MNDLISIIVPVYNVEKYLDVCVHSLVEQTYTNIEIILVDDGSPDNCPAMCDAWAEKDSRIRVIHQKNRGLSSARNTGLKIFKGNYVTFVDSDDYVNIHFIEYLYRLICENRAEISVCHFVRLPESVDQPIHIQPNGEWYVCTGDDLQRTLLAGVDYIGGIVCNKLFSRRLFDTYRIMFPDGKLYEDICTSHKLLHFSNTVAVSSYPMYYYRLSSGSIMRTNLTCKKCIDHLDSLKAVLDDYCCWRVEDIAAKRFTQFLRTAVVLYHNTQDIGIPMEQIKAREHIKEQYRLCWKEYQGKISIPFVKWMVFRLFSFFPNLISWIFGEFLTS